MSQIDLLHTNRNGNALTCTILFWLFIECFFYRIFVTWLILMIMKIRMVNWIVNSFVLETFHTLEVHKVDRKVLETGR